MRTLAIGDIHGCRTALDALLGLVAVRPEDRLIALGDYVDRGPDSRGVLDRMLELRAAGRLIALRGNHDVMMLQARAGEEVGMWLSCGGRETMASYGVAVRGTFCGLEAVPEEHWDFLENGLLDWYETEGHLFVHGSVCPDLPMDEQPEYMLHWEKLVGPVAHCSGKVIVCGHTKQHSGRPLDWGSVICIDTGAYDRHGWLTCLDVGTGEYWQANQAGERRGGRLG
jgi:serine/threonine protein phosphatase 1